MNKILISLLTTFDTFSVVNFGWSLKQNQFMIAQTKTKTALFSYNKYPNKLDIN